MIKNLFLFLVKIAMIFGIYHVGLSYKNDFGVGWSCCILAWISLDVFNYIFKIGKKYEENNND